MIRAGIRRTRPSVLASAAALALLGALAPGARAGTIAVVDGTAVFRAVPGETNDLTLGEQPPGDLTALGITDAGAPLTVGAGCVRVDANSAACPDDPDGQRPVVVHGGDGNDRIDEEDRSRPVALYGGRGDDEVTSGSGIGKSPVLGGGPGDDDLSVYNNGGGTPVMRGGLGDDSVSVAENGEGLLFGNAGNDRLYFSGNSPASEDVRLRGGRGADTYGFGGLPAAGARMLVRGPGIDTLDLSASRSFGPVDLNACPRCVERVIGSPHDDEIIGDAGPQTILGGDGADVLEGGAAPDLIAGQDGDDAIDSRDGSPDLVSCGPGIDAVSADRFDIVLRDCEGSARSP